ncbi:MAG TPA: hypothetical protein VLM76_01360 [Patescibacteria group bacterium]|nr:hypothetical protein [Patescibacteria group bacterium]
MSALEAVANVLAAAGEPLRVDEITARVLASGQWASKGKTPAVRDWPKQTHVPPVSPAP